MKTQTEKCKIPAEKPHNDSQKIIKYPYPTEGAGVREEGFSLKRAKTFFKQERLFSELSLQNLLSSPIDS